MTASGDIYAVTVNATGLAGEMIYAVYAEDNVGLADSSNLSTLNISAPPDDLSIADLLADLSNCGGNS